jgi:hypothetical protein
MQHLVKCNTSLNATPREKQEGKGINEFWRISHLIETLALLTKPLYFPNVKYLK